jgi:hypothetical protein
MEQHSVQRMAIPSKQQSASSGSKHERRWPGTHGSLGSMVSSEDSNGDSASSEANIGRLLC